MKFDKKRVVKIIWIISLVVVLVIPSVVFWSNGYELFVDPGYLKDVDPGSDIYLACSAAQNMGMCFAAFIFIGYELLDFLIGRYRKRKKQSQ